MGDKASRLQELSNNDLEGLIRNSEEKFEKIISFVETVAKGLGLPYSHVHVTGEPELCWPQEPSKPLDEYLLKEFHGFTIEYRDWSWKYGESNTQRCVGLNSKGRSVLFLVYDGASSEKGNRIRSSSYTPGHWEEELAVLMAKPVKAIDAYKELINQKNYQTSKRLYEKQAARAQEINEHNCRIELMERAKALGLAKDC
ncbi:MAG: hypothetical protein NTY99_00335 [DPANN group archaeon]|nr:hypothetical protein [DPANN group archaeon]